MAKKPYSQAEHISGGANPLDIFFERYGPHAFGVASLLLIWFTIVKPEMARNRIDWETQQDIVQQQQRTADVMNDTADTLIRAAEILDRATP